MNVKTMLAAAVLLVPLLARAEVDKKTERLWKSKCASCHGADGKGKTDQGQKMGIPDYTAAAWQKEFTDDQIKKAINDGVQREKDGKKQDMPGYKDSLQPDQVDALVKYIRSLKAG